MVATGNWGTVTDTMGAGAGVVGVVVLHPAPLGLRVHGSVTVSTTLVTVSPTFWTVSPTLSTTVVRVSTTPPSSSPNSRRSRRVSALLPIYILPFVLSQAEADKDPISNLLTIMATATWPLVRN